MSLLQGNSQAKVLSAYYVPQTIPVSCPLFLAVLYLCSYAWAFSSCTEWASQCSGLSCWRIQALGLCGLGSVVHRFSCPVACGVFPLWGLNSTSLALAGGILNRFDHWEVLLWCFCMDATLIQSWTWALLFSADRWRNWGTRRVPCLRSHTNSFGIKAAVGQEIAEYSSVLSPSFRNSASRNKLSVWSMNWDGVIFLRLQGTQQANDPHKHLWRGMGSSSARSCSQCDQQGEWWCNFPFSHCI